MKNLAILIGNLGADPETSYMQDGTCVCNIRLATTERYKDKSGERQERTEWHRVVLWGKLGEIANQYLHKGSQVYIDGKIETRKWTDRDGQERYTTEIRANDMKMLGGKGDTGSQNATQPQKPAKTSDYSQDPFNSDANEQGGDVDESLPF